MVLRIKKKKKKKRRNYFSSTRGMLTTVLGITLAGSALKSLNN